MDIKNFNAPGKASVLFGGGFGSEGKGLAAAYVALNSPCTISVTNAAPNAGHTTILPDGRKFITYHLPTAGVINEDATIYLDAGAIIDPPKLYQELEEVGVDRERVYIHPRAAVITQEDKDYEANKASGTTKIASTQKGCGRALARKIMREGMVAGDCPELRQFINTFDLNHELDHGHRVMIEMPQGFSLGINSGCAYPYCTSRDVTVAQALSDAGVHPYYLGNVLMCLRTYPIRVGSIMDEYGNELGSSGPVYPDQRELSFEELGLAPEYTTVTKRKRRIFDFSMEQYAQSVAANRPTHVFLNFVNYLKSEHDLRNLVNTMMLTDYAIYKKQQPPALLFGAGPCTSDVLDNFDAIATRLWSDHVEPA